MSSFFSSFFHCFVRLIVGKIYKTHQGKLEDECIPAPMKKKNTKNKRGVTEMKSQKGPIWNSKNLRRVKTRIVSYFVKIGVGKRIFGTDPLLGINLKHPNE